MNITFAGTIKCEYVHSNYSVIQLLYPQIYSKHTTAYITIATHHNNIKQHYNQAFGIYGSWKFECNKSFLIAIHDQYTYKIVDTLIFYDFKDMFHNKKRKISQKFNMYDVPIKRYFSL